MIRVIFRLALLAVTGLVLAGCGPYGEVEQGRTVGFDAEKREVTMILDAGIDDLHPQYTILPAHVFKLPDDPAETGPLPFAGLRMNLDIEAKTITMYNKEEGAFEKFDFELVEKHEGVDVNKQHPLVFDKETNKPREFPVINESLSQIEIYSKRQKLLVTIKVPAEALERYKGTDWDAGDEIRIYYKDPAKALRFMNVTNTDIFKK